MVHHGVGKDSGGQCAKPAGRILRERKLGSESRRRARDGAPSRVYFLRQPVEGTGSEDDTIRGLVEDK